MPRQGQASVSAVALEQAPPPQALLPAGALMGEAGSRKTLRQMSALTSQLKEQAIQRLLPQAVKAVETHNFQRGSEIALQILEHDERSGMGWYILGVVREQAGDFASSIQAYELALKLMPDFTDIANDLGRLAYRMGMKEQSEKLFRHFFAANPDRPEAANNLACAIRERGGYEEAIEVLKPILGRQPREAMLWNTLGTVLFDQGDLGNAETFLREAVKLKPRFANALHNLANVRLFQGSPEDALSLNTRALSLETEASARATMHMLRAHILLTLQRLPEAWEAYESRLDHQFAESTQFYVDRPRWTPGADIAGQSFLVIAEQGLGDEILFGTILPDILDRLGPEGRLTLAVEPRLVSLFQRSFPGVEVHAHSTHHVGGHVLRFVPGLTDPSSIDLWTPMASLLREYRAEIGQFPERAGYLTPDPTRVAYWRDQLAALPGRKVGLLWKSASSANARHRYYSPMEQWAPVLRRPGVTFVNLQYGDSSEELALAKQEMGVDIWTPSGIDLKQDLDDVAALSCAVDLTIGFSNATFNIAAGCGAPVWLLTIPARASWTLLGEEDRYVWYPQARVFSPAVFGQWDQVMADVGDALAAFTAER